MKAKNLVSRSKNGVMKWTKVRGVWDRSTGKFLPYPLPVQDLDIHDDSNFSVEMAVRRDDPKAWGNGGKTPLAIEFKVQFYVSDRPYQLSHFLLRRARKLGVGPEALPKKATLEVTEDEEKAILRAKQAVRAALWYPILRWANLEEADEPTGLRVPKEVPLGKDRKDPSLYGDGRPVPVRRIVTQDASLRERARRRLRGDALRAFNTYCQLWDARFKKADGAAAAD